MYSPPSRPWVGAALGRALVGALCSAACSAVCASPAVGQARAIDGSPAPVAPEVITRDSLRRPTIRAIRLTEPLHLDGVLDEAVYTREKPFGGLIQVAPDYGQPATERSDIWITYDDQNIYLSCRCYDQSPPETWVVNELRRDTNGLRNNEHIGVMLDTYYDRRSGFAFYTNPLGARADYSVVDEGGSNTDWNPVWTSKTGRFDGGWTVEMAIPLKSLRYRAGKDQVWGIQIRRSIRHKNEWDYLTPVPRILAGPQALNRVSAGGTLVALDLPESGRNIELKPYAISRVTTDNVRTPPVHDEVKSDVGGDVKYAVTPNLTADLTVNTDFAQVEVDEQQVNLTRFNLFYPEKRDFFLEGRGIFDFARGGQGVTSGSDQSDTPYLFYTRRIGLDNGRVIPINEGGRLTGKLGPWAVGLMDIQTGADASSASKPTNYGILRLKRDILGHSAIGVMATDRSVGASGAGSNTAFGADATLALTQALLVSTYWAQTNTTGAATTGGNQSYQGFADYADDLYGAHAEYLSVGANFDPQVGFIRRSDFNRSFGSLRYSPRPTRYIPSVRKFTWSGSGEYVENGAGAVDARTFAGSFNTEFQSSDQFSISATREYEYLRKPFTPSGSPAPIPVGGYTFDNASISYSWGAQRRISGALTLQAGHYYDGTITSIAFGSGGSFATQRVVFGRLALEPTLQITEIDRPAGSYTTRIVRTRADYAFSPLMFVSALLQYSSADRAFSTNLRYRWEYAPGSELFLVYTDERDTTPDALATPTTVRGIRNRAFVVKINRLFRY
ncbi:MAG TPA: DUF5916 domain-containing protein [Gemmatimonadaceae bacterium]|nr:DUF5916 domain-containing protein [Gemmatimonadaceae bacterium]